MKNFVFIFIFIISQYALQAQTTDIFQTLTNDLKTFVPDTTNPPDDKMTRKIVELRSLRGGFNINEAISFKIAEEKAKGEKPVAELEKLASYFNGGPGMRLLNNAVTWIYRQEFTYAEMKKLVRFYKTNAGQKLSSRFPLIMLRSLAASEIITKGIQ